MKRVIVLLIVFFSITNISESQSGWIQKYSGTNNTLASICMVDSLNGYIVGYNGKILKTVNGGENWVTLVVQITDDFTSMFFLNKDTGFVTGAFRGILKTFNGGYNWTNQPQNYDEIDNIHFFSKNLATATAVKWIMPYGYPSSYSLKSVNGGNTWSEYYLGDDVATTSFFVDSLNGFLGWYEGIYKTNNGGNSWAFIPLVNSEYYRCLNFLNINTGFMISSGGHIKKTTNGGINWTIIYQSTNNEYLGGFFINENTGYASGNSQIIKTKNGGQSWVIQYSNYESRGLYDMVFLNPLVGLVVGENGIILKTTNGGEPLGIESISNDIPTKYDLFPNYPNPFNPTTKIKFDVPTGGNSRDHSVRLIIYDILGRQVATIVNEQLKPGSYEAEWDGSSYASGIYFYQLITENFTQTKRMVLIK